MTDAYMENVRASHRAGRAEKVAEARADIFRAIDEADWWFYNHDDKDTVTALLAEWEQRGGDGTDPDWNGDGRQWRYRAAWLRRTRAAAVDELNRLYQWPPHTAGVVTEEEL